jgi:hypothetical protein
MAAERRRAQTPAEGKRATHPLLQELQKDEEEIAALIGRIANGRGNVAMQMEPLELAFFPWLAVLEDVILPHAAATLKSDVQESVATASLRVDLLDTLIPRGRAAGEPHERRAWCSLVEQELSALSLDVRTITRLLAKGDLDALHRSASTLRREIGGQFRLQ